MNINKVIAAGYLFKDPSIRFNPEGNAATIRFEFGSTETWRDRQSGENRTNTERFVAVKFNASAAQADFIKREFKKGTNIYVEGRNRTRKWRPEGATEDRYNTEVVINNDFEALQKIGDPKGSSKPAPQQNQQASAPAPAPASQPAHQQSAPAHQEPPAYMSDVPMEFPDDYPIDQQGMNAGDDVFADLRVPQQQ